VIEHSSRFGVMATYRMTRDTAHDKSTWRSCSRNPTSRTRRWQVGHILSEAQIKPHRVKMWCHSMDPAFQEKMGAIVKLYVRRPKGQPVLCIDEKTGMQVLLRSRALQPPRPGNAGRLEFEYRRHGTRCLFACFNIGTGRVLGRCTTTRKRRDFLSFMDWVASVYRQRLFMSCSTT
jgi:hypothetical protein